MRKLNKDQRNLLAKTVLLARDTAETGAKKALHTLGVNESNAPSHLSSELRELRRALRAQARQLGDGEDLNRPGIYSIWHLTEKIAYDQWHRMLFARFLAENDLLISPQHQVAVTLEECNDLAPELGLRDGWEVAARFAAEMLPQIFRADDPAGQITLAPEDRSALQHYVIDLPREIFLSDDALGWVYQFWQEKRKDEVNRSEKKIGADELAPVTQLFTEDYMVLFLLHNTLGAWWAGKHLDKVSGCTSEEECRKTLALNGIEWPYLRFIKNEKTGQWRPAAGTFNGWPKSAKEITILDPCMGSGHFLTFSLPIIVAFRMEEENLTKQEACDSVIRDNLFGLELDMRCTQIGAFNLALTAWKMAGYRALPPLNIACCGLGINARREDWLSLAKEDAILIDGLNKLYHLFQQAPVLGSLINPLSIEHKGTEDWYQVNIEFHKLQPLLEKALGKEAKDDSINEMAVTARGLAKAVKLLAGRYTLVATNVPYLGRGKQDEGLKEHLETHYPFGKADLATAFILRCLEFCAKGGGTALVTPQNWLFLITYTKLRQMLLKSRSWNMVARLGPGAFETISGHVVNVAMPIISAAVALDGHLIAGINVSGAKMPVEKAVLLHKETSVEIALVKQEEQLKNPDARITLNALSGEDYLFKVTDCYQGVKTGDNNRLCIRFWELPRVMQPWRLMQSSASRTCDFDGCTDLINWHNDGAMMARLQGLDALGAFGIGIGSVSSLPVCFFLGQLYDSAIIPIISKNEEYLPAIAAFCFDPSFRESIRKVDQKIAVTTTTVLKVPFDFDYWQKVAAEKYPNGLPEPESDDPTQWLFHGRPEHSTAPLQVAVARLLGYRWPAELDKRMHLSERAQELVRCCEELLPFADDDGIVCISAIRGEHPAAERLRELLATIFGSEWNSDKQTKLLKEVGFEGKNLEDWLRNGFFEQHSQLFHQRPFIWHIWDGRKDGFSVLVNYHKLDKPMLEKLTYTYLGDWITRQKSAVDAGEEGSDARLAAALDLKGRLEKILEGELPYDIFIRWKPIEKQPIGWEPDLNDGVRMNIRPFITAGVLRKNPRINWNKDRGKDVESAPWYHLFKGNRINDHHLPLDEKRKARERK